MRASAARISLAAAGSPGLRPTIRGGSSASGELHAERVDNADRAELEQGAGIDLDDDRGERAIAIASAARAKAAMSLEPIARLARSIEIVTAAL